MPKQPKDGKVYRKMEKQLKTESVFFHNKVFLANFFYFCNVKKVRVLWIIRLLCGHKYSKLEFTRFLSQKFTGILRIYLYFWVPRHFFIANFRKYLYLHNLQYCLKFINVFESFLALYWLFFNTILVSFPSPLYFDNISIF